MISPPVHHNENERIKDLNSYSILDTLPEKDYDNLTTIAAEITGTPIALISLIDTHRQWFKSRFGLDATETPRELAFCAHAINDPNKILNVQDARTDKRFHDNPLVVGEPRVIFYAGIPLISSDGLPLGTLCVIDHKPNLLSKGQLKSLEALANQVINLLELRRNKILLEQTQASLEEKNEDLERFAFLAAHDLKSPLMGISNMSKLFLEEYKSKVDKDGQNMLRLITSSTDKLKNLIDGLLNYSRSDAVLKEDKSTVNLATLHKEMAGLFNYDHDLNLMFKSTLTKIKTNKAALDQILINLIANAIKYSDKERIKINVGISESRSHYKFFVQDNGPGISLEHQEQIFKIFEICAEKDKFGHTGNGIGLATVKKLVESSGGSIKVHSELGKGAKFIFSLEK